MQKVLLVLLEFLLFLAAFTVASFLRPFHVVSTLGRTANGDRSFVWDGLLLMVGLYFLILLIAALSKRLRAGVTLATLAMVLAAIVGLAMKLGFVTHEM